MSFIFSLRSPLALGVQTSTRYERKCEIYFIVSEVLAQQILAGLRKVAGKQSLVLKCFKIFPPLRHPCQVRDPDVLAKKSSVGKLFGLSEMEYGVISSLW